MFEVNNKVIFIPIIMAILMIQCNQNTIRRKNSVVINAFVGCGKSHAIIQTIKEYYNTTDYLIIVASPYVSLVQHM